MHRLAALLSTLFLLLSSAWAEEQPYLARCISVKDASSFLDFPSADESGTLQPASVQAGRIRYISQSEGIDPLFCAACWIGGQPGDELDLTLTMDINRVPYTYHAKVMCTRAVYSMILSYFGVDLTPGAMSALMEQRDLDEPYDQVTDLLPTIRRVSAATHRLNPLWENYQHNPETYSPIYLYILKPNGIHHALLLVGATGNPGEFIVVDPAYHEIDKQSTPVFTIVFNRDRDEILRSTFHREFAGSKVKRLYQWEKISE